MPLRIVGLSAFYHDSACCLLEDGRLIAAAQEERFSRRKHDPRLPVEAFRFCLAQAGVGPHEIDAVAYYEPPARRLARQLWAARPELPPVELDWLDPGEPERQIRERLGLDAPLLTFDHHASHAASAFAYSGFGDAAILTADGVGTWTTTAFGRGGAGGVELFSRVSFPHSLGLLYATITAYLGFPVGDGEARVMGLAAYGTPRLVGALRRLITIGDGLDYRLDLRYFDFVRGPRMWSPALEDLLGQPPRSPNAPIARCHEDLAASLQRLTEEVLLTLASRLAAVVASPNLCLAGGVALNCVANARLRREGPFRQLFVQPAAGDAGGALGAAALAHRRLTGLPVAAPLVDVRLGPGWSAAQVAALLAAAALPAEDYRDDEAALAAAVAARLEAGEIVGWFQGRMELGPRALGARSLLADPRRGEARERLNARIKGREAFRPFAPAVLLAETGRYFALDRPSPFMLETARVKDPGALRAVTHVDGTARVQTVDPAVMPRFAALLAAFGRRTGCPVLLSTSLNRAGEPIVCSPADALFCFGRSGMDSLAIEDFVIGRDSLPASWDAQLPVWMDSPSRPRRGALERNLYTFV